MQGMLSVLDFDFTPSSCPDSFPTLLLLKFAPTAELSKALEPQ
jgi:hypothetical protein